MARDFTKNTSNYVSLGTNTIGPLINGASGVALAAWVYINSFTAAQTFSNYVHCFNIATTLNGLVLTFDTTGGGSSNFLKGRVRSAAGEAGQVAIGATNITTGAWHHVGLSADIAGDKIALYLNGALEVETTVTFSSTTWSNAGTQTVADSIGSALTTGDVVSSTASQMDGDIAEAAVWKSTLTAAQFVSLSKGITPDQISPQNLVAYWPMIGSEGIIDIRNGKNATITGSVPVATHHRVYA